MNDIRIGPPATLYRLHRTNSRRGWYVQRWNRAASRWDLSGYERARNIADTLVRFGIATWVEAV